MVFHIRRNSECTQPRGKPCIGTQKVRSRIFPVAQRLKTFVESFSVYGSGRSLKPLFAPFGSQRLGQSLHMLLPVDIDAPVSI